MVFDVPSPALLVGGGTFSFGRRARRYSLTEHRNARRIA